MWPPRPRAGRVLRVAVATVVLGSGLWSVDGARPAGAQDDRPRIEVPASIDATGGADVTAALDDFFAGVPDGAIVNFPRGGRYRAEGTVDIVDRSGITIRGNGSTIFARSQGDLKRVHVAVIRGRNIRIERLNVVGAHPSGGIGDDGYQADYEGQHGFAIRGTDGIELDSVSVSDVYGDFVYLGKPEDGDQWARRVWIHDSLFVRNGRQGLAIVAAQGVVFERNGIAQVARSTIDLEPNTESGGAIDVQILNNEVGPGRLLFVAAAGNGPVGAVVISGNRLTGRVLTVTILPPPGARRDRFWIVGNVSGTPAKNTPIKVNRTDGVVVWRNRQVVPQGEPAVEVSEVCGLTVAENDFGEFAKNVNEPVACGSILGPVPPAPPEVFGRATGPEPEPQLPSTTTTTTAPGPTPIVPTTGERQNWAITITLGVIATAMVVAALLLRSRRADRPQRPAPPSAGPPPPDGATGGDGTDDGTGPTAGPPTAPPVDAGAR